MSRVTYRDLETVKKTETKDERITDVINSSSTTNDELNKREESISEMFWKTGLKIEQESTQVELLRQSLNFLAKNQEELTIQYEDLKIENSEIKAELNELKEFITNLDSKKVKKSINFNVIDQIREITTSSNNIKDIFYNIEDDVFNLLIIYSSESNPIEIRMKIIEELNKIFDNEEDLYFELEIRNDMYNISEDELDIYSKIE